MAVCVIPGGLTSPRLNRLPIFLWASCHLQAVTARKSRSFSISYNCSAPERRLTCFASEDNTGPSFSSTASPSDFDLPETVCYEGNGSDAELIISILLGFTLIYLPLTLASVGRRLWISYKFTNKRIIVTTNSPVLKREVQVEYSKIKEVRSVCRAGGLWGDMVIFLKDGSRLELMGVDSNFRDIENYIQQSIS